MKKVFKKIASNTLSQIFSKAITAIISIFLIGLLTKYLPMELYGSYNKVFNYLGIFAFLADLGLYTIAVREISRYQEKTSMIIGNVLTIRTLLGLLIWIIACLWALVLPWYHDPLTFIAISIIGWFTLVSLINSSLLALMQSQMKMEFSVISLIGGKLLNISLVALCLVYFFTGIEQQNIAFISVFVAAFFGIFLTTFLNYCYARKITDIRYRWDFEYMKHIFKISLPYGLALFLSVVYFKVDIILLSLLEPAPQADISIALYSLPMKIVEVLMVLGWFYLNSLLPSLSELAKQNNYTQISKILWLSLKVLASFWIFIFIAGNLFAKQIIEILATPEYLSGWGAVYSSLDVIPIVLGVLLFHFIALAYIYIFIATERQAMMLKINIWVTIFNIIGNIILIPHYSFIGAGITTLLSQVFLMILAWIGIRKQIHIPWRYFFHIFMSVALGGVLYFFFQIIIPMSRIENSIYVILLFWSLLLSVYVWSEYIISKKLKLF